MISVDRLERIPSSGWETAIAKAVMAFIAGAAGFLLAVLPLPAAIISFLCVIVIVATVIQPLAGLAVTLIFATFKPLTDYFVPELPLDVGQLFLLLTLGAWMIHAIRRKQFVLPHTPLTLPLFAFIGVAMLGLPGALSSGAALKELIKWGQLVVVMWLVIDLAGPRKWPVVLGMTLAAGVVQALIGVWQFGLRGDGPEHFLILGDRFYRAYGTFEQPNPYGGFIGIILPVAAGLMLSALSVWYGSIRPLWRTRPLRLPHLFLHSLNRQLAHLSGIAVLALLLLAALFMSWSRGAWLGFGAACLMILFAWPRRVWHGALLAIGAVAFGIIALHFNLLPDAVASRLTDFSEYTEVFDVRGVDITTENYAVIERLAHWQAAEEMARTHLLVGVGLGNYEPVYPLYALMNWPYPLGHAHNIYLNMLAETGIIGLLAYLVLWGVIFWQTWRVTRSQNVWHRGVAVGLLGAWTHLAVHQMVDTLYVANIHLHIGALLGVLSILILIEYGRRKTLVRNN